MGSGCTDSWHFSTPEGPLIFEERRCHGTRCWARVCTYWPPPTRRLASLRSWRFCRAPASPNTALRRCSSTSPLSPPSFLLCLWFCLSFHSPPPTNTTTIIESIPLNDAGCVSVVIMVLMTIKIKPFQLTMFAYHAF